MTIQSIAYLKDRFSCGKKPTQGDFYDLIDTLSFLPRNFCDIPPVFNIIQECGPEGITVEGSLYVTKALSAFEAYIINLSGENAFLSNLTSNNIIGQNAYFTNLVAASTILNVVNITSYEISGFNITGDLSANGVIYAKGGNSDDWNSVYSTVCTNSSYWDANFCNEIVYLNQVSACDANAISVTGNVNILNDLTVFNSVSSPRISANDLYVGNSSIHFYNGTVISSPSVGYVNINSDLTVNQSISTTSLYSSGAYISLLSLPEPIIRLKGVNSISAVDLDGGGLDKILSIERSPYIVVDGFTEDQLQKHQIYVEMVVLNRKRKSKYKPRQSKSFIVASNWGSKRNVPWGDNFRTRSVRDIAIGGFISVDRPNHYQVQNFAQVIPVWEYFNGRFCKRDIDYLTTNNAVSSIPAYIDTGIPKSKFKIVGASFPERIKYAYNRRFKPFRVAFRYVIWSPNANGGKGEIITGPLSRSLKVTSKSFPFNINHVKSSLIGRPAADINTVYYSTSASLICNWNF